MHWIFLSLELREAPEKPAERNQKALGQQSSGLRQQRFYCSSACPAQLQPHATPFNSSLLSNSSSLAESFQFITPPAQVGVPEGTGTALSAGDRCSEDHAPFPDTACKWPSSHRARRSRRTDAALPNGHLWGPNGACLGRRESLRKPAFV